MLTLEKLKEMQPDQIFERGTLRQGRRNLRWVATRGDVEDWAIYSQLKAKGWTDEQIRARGDKIYDPPTIRRLVPCDEEALSYYRK